ncbi:MAG: HDOD domain-containing protein [Deltaproteobacteria bacterium]|nr:HDOD domain-containing protein [Deltaproteobacteria bacterium]
MSSINSIIKKIERLTPIPQVTSKVMSIAEDPKSSMYDLSKVIIYDTAVTANLLKLINSAYFGLPEKVDSVHQAIVYLGMSQVVDLVLLSASGKNLQTAQEGYDLKAGELWKYSVSSALIAREIAEKKGAFEKINALVTEQNFTFREAEKEVIGIDHAELGGMVADTITGHRKPQ